MKQDTHKTKVKFLMEKDLITDDITLIGDVFAIFPEETRTGADRTKLTECYAHVGQHSEACEEYINECTPATPEQYKDLKQELESLGYNLEIIN
jgi:hypothetical protein